MKVHALWQQGEVIWMCSSGRLTTAALTGSISTPGKLSNLLDWLEPPNTTHLVTLQSASISWCPLISLPCSYSRYPLRYGKSPHQLISSIKQLNQLSCFLRSRQFRDDAFRDSSGASRCLGNGKRGDLRGGEKGDRRRETRSALASEVARERRTCSRFTLA